jgi:hypothetical protein
VAYKNRTQKRFVDDYSISTHISQFLDALENQKRKNILDINFWRDTREGTL